MQNLANYEDHTEILETMRNQLFRILDPEQVNRQAFSDQKAMIETLGGIPGIEAMESFNHTPVE